MGLRVTPPAYNPAGGGWEMSWGWGLGTGGDSDESPPACSTCSCCLLGEWAWFVAPPAVNDAGGAMGDGCGVHLSAPTHNRLKYKPIMDMLM